MPASDPQTKAQALLELYEPIFQKICFLNRAGRKVGRCDYAETRQEVELLLQQVQERASQDNYLARHEEKLRAPIIFFINSMIGASQLDLASTWLSDLLQVPGYNAARGNVEFFKLLEQTLGDPSEDATERLAVFFVCLGLGFTGNGMKSGEELEDLMARLRPKVKSLGLLETDLQSPISATQEHEPEKVDMRGEKEMRWVIICGILFFCFTVAILTTYFRMYGDAIESLKNSTDFIAKKGTAHE